MHVELPKDLSQYLEQAIQAGRFRDVAEALAAAVRSLRETEARLPHHDPDQLAAIQEVLGRIERGEERLYDADEFFRELRERADSDGRRPSRE